MATAGTQERGNGILTKVVMKETESKISLMGKLIELHDREKKMSKMTPRFLAVYMCD